MQSFRRVLSKEEATYSAPAISAGNQPSESPFRQQDRLGCVEVRALCSGCSSWGCRARQANMPMQTELGGQLAQPATSRALSLRHDALDPNYAEAGVFGANLVHGAPLFVLECLDRVHVGEL